MNLKLKLILMAVVLLISSAAHAQKVSDKSGIKLRGTGQRLVLTSRGVRRTLDLKDAINAARIDKVKLLFVSRSQSFVYLVVDICGPSKPVPDARRCGAADECNLLWLKLDSAWKINEVKSAPYESCWKSSTASDGYKISGQKLQMEYDDFSEKKHYKLSYDADQPERGFNITESALAEFKLKAGGNRTLS